MFRATLVLFGLLLLSGNLQAQINYHVDEIDIPEGLLQVKLNNHGEIRGNIQHFNDGWHYFDFSWSADHGLQMKKDIGVELVDFNDHGNVVGYLSYEYGVPVIGNAEKGYQKIDLPEGVVGWPIGMNNLDQVLILTPENGYMLWDAEGGARPLVWPEGVSPQELYLIDERRLNDSADVLFRSAILSQDQTVRYLPEIENYSIAGLALNNAGDVVGYKQFNPQDYSISRQIGMIWTHDGKQFEVAIDNADVQFVDINDQGNALGNIDQPCYQKHMGPFVWTEEEGRIQLQPFVNKRGWEITEAISINNRGQILLSGYHKKSFEEHLFLLTPTDQ